MMIKSKSQMPKRISFDLSGPDGNAYVLLGAAGKLAEQLDLDPAAIKAEMKSGDYENLIAVFEKHFGDIVMLYR